MADETRTIGEAWARATRLSKDGQLHEATVGFLRLRALLHEQNFMVRGSQATVPGGDTGGASTGGPAPQGGAGAVMRVAPADSSPTRRARKRAVGGVIDKLLSKVDEEVRSHLGFLQSNPYAALQLPLPEGASASASAGAGAGAFGVSRRNSDSSGCPVVTDALVKSNYRRLALRFHPDKTAGTDSSPLFAAIRTAYETLATSRGRALHKPRHCPRPTVSPDGSEFYWTVQTEAVVAVGTMPTRGVSDAAAATAATGAALRGSASSGGAWRAEQEQDDRNSIGRLVSQRKQSNDTAMNDSIPKTPADVSSFSGDPIRCDGNDAAAAAAAADSEWHRGKGVCELEVPRQGQRHGQGGGGRPHGVQPEKKRGPVGDDGNNKTEKQHQLGKMYSPRDYRDVEEGEKRGTRGVGLDRRDDAGTNCSETGNTARSRSYSTSPQDAKRTEEEEEEEGDRQWQNNRCMEEEERERWKTRHMKLTWENRQKERGPGFVDGTVGRRVGALIGKSTNARQSPGHNPAAFFFANEGDGSGFQQQHHHHHHHRRYQNDGDMAHHQPNRPISVRRGVNAQPEEDSTSPGSHHQPSPVMTGAARANNSPLRPPSPPDELSRAAPCSSSPVQIETELYPENGCRRLHAKPRLQVKPQQSAAAAVSGVDAARAPMANVGAADASKETSSGGGAYAWREGRNEAGEVGGRPHEEGALFLHEPFQDDQGTEAGGGGSGDGNSSSSGGGGRGGGAGGVGVGGCVRRLRERVTPKGLAHHATCSSATYAYQLQQEVDFWVSGAQREGVWRESCTFPAVTGGGNRTIGSVSAITEVPVLAGGVTTTGGGGNPSPMMMGHGARRHRHRRRRCRGGRNALPSERSSAGDSGSDGNSNSDLDSDNNSDDEDTDAVGRLVREQTARRNAAGENGRGRAKSNEALPGTAAILSSTGGVSCRRVHVVSRGGRFNRKFSEASRATTTAAVATAASASAAGAGAAASRAATAAVESFEQAAVAAGGAGQGWFWGAPS